MSVNSEAEELTWIVVPLNVREVLAWWRGADGSARRLVVRVDLAMHRHDEGRGSKGLLWCSGRRKVRVMNAKHVTSVSKNVYDSLELDLFNDQTATSVHLFFGNR